jgi:hypothetical protein
MLIHKLAPGKSGDFFGNKKRLFLLFHAKCISLFKILIKLYNEALG